MSFEQDDIHQSLGLPPGTPVFVGQQQVDEISIRVIQYSSTEYDDYRIDEIETEFPKLLKNKNTWINVTGIHDVEKIELLGSKLGVDTLIIEDIVNTSSRPKIEDLGDNFFLIVKDLGFDKSNLQLEIEHMAFFVSANVLVTFQEKEFDHFDVIRERIKRKQGQIRKSGIDYLFNRLLDTIVDNYFGVVHQLGEIIEELEDQVVVSPTKDVLTLIQKLKQETIYIRRLVLPTREVVGIISKLDSIVISNNTLVFVRSIYDHLNQIIDSIEIYREMLSGFLDIYLSSLSNKTNDVMKVLTIVTSVFIPLSFLAGLYGMNFEHMPELQLKFAYPLLLFLMLTIASGMLYYFKQLGWFRI